jgi:hypothetical protein
MSGRLITYFLLNLICCSVFAQTIPDAISIAASDKYKSPSLFKKIINGTNYRKEWETPVTMPVFDLKRSKLKIKELGGGQQTTSLYLVDENKNEWVLRSVDKEVKPPKEFMENTFIERVIQDHVSAAYPYAGLSVSHLSKAAGVISGESKLYYVPDDTAFGEYRSVMANKVFQLISYMPEKIEELSTEEMLKKLRADKKYAIDQKEYLKVRLIDWLISDWDRHIGQYKWIEKTNSSGIAFQVVPRDRDQAFFRSNGLLIKFISMLFLPHMSGFAKSKGDIKRLSFKAKSMDKICTDQLSKEDWIRITKDFQTNISDEVIESAIKKQPPEIFAIRGNQIIEILKFRRNYMLENVMKYYSVLTS